MYDLLFTDCSTNNEVRLQDLAAQVDCNLDYFIGRVELCNGSVWKLAVCDDQWTTEDAMVACRESGNIAEGRMIIESLGDYFKQALHVDYSTKLTEVVVLVLLNVFIFDRCSSSQHYRTRIK